MVRKVTQAAADEVAAESYDDILDRSWSEMPKALNLPLGTYELEGRNASFLKADTDKNLNARVLIFDKVIQPMEDVDEDAIRALGENYDFTNNEVVTTIWLEKDVDWDEVNQNLQKRGLDTDSMTLRESLKAVKGTRVLAYLNQGTFTTRSGEVKTENRATSFAAVSDGSEE